MDTWKSSMKRLGPCCVGNRNLLMFADTIGKQPLPGPQDLTKRMAFESLDVSSRQLIKISPTRCPHEFSNGFRVFSVAELWCVVLPSSWLWKPTEPPKQIEAHVQNWIMRGSWVVESGRTKTKLDSTTSGNEGILQLGCFVPGGISGQPSQTGNPASWSIIRANPS